MSHYKKSVVQNWCNAIKWNKISAEMYSKINTFEGKFAKSNRLRKVIIFINVKHGKVLRIQCFRYFPFC